MKVQFLVLLAALSLISGTAKADGFLCQGKETGTQFKIYNKLRASEGNRNVAVMVVSDPKVDYGRKTIAMFSDLKNTLSNVGSHYTANVDLRVKESNRKGENIAGTKLGELNTINVIVFFNYSKDTPSFNGAKFKGTVEYLKRNGEVISEPIACTRYLKN